MSIDVDEISFRREIKSYVLRSRKTDSQQRAIDLYWPLYGIEVVEQIVPVDDIFQRAAPTIVEIGFGMGTSLLAMAKKNPALNFLGIEVHQAGIGALLAGIHEQGITNVRVICKDAVDVLTHNLANESLKGILVFFPDPWPKRRHHKRRLIQSPFVDLVFKKLTASGYFHLATDIVDYAKQMESVLTKHNGFAIINGPHQLPENLMRPRTKFEHRGERLGHKITDLVFVKTAS